MRKSRLSMQARLFSVPGVVSVGWGYKVKGGKQLGRECLVVGVEKKRRFVWPWHKISNLVSQETDVVETGKIVALRSRTAKWRPALGGVSVGHRQVSAGTLGCLVRVKGEQGWHILSNNHVLADCNAGVIGDSIVQPGVADGGDLDYLGWLAGFESLDFTGGKNYADCAIATPDHQQDVSSEILEIGEPTGYGEVQLGTAVQKSGRTTAVTTGTVQQIGVTVQVAYADNQIAMFHDQILTGCMSKGGDSGSVLLDMDRKIVGLLFAGSDTVTCHSPIKYVVGALNLDTEEPSPPDSVKRNLWGLHGPNHDPTNIEAMTSLGCDCYTVLAKWEQVGLIRKARPNALILLRPYWGPTNLDEDPVEVAYWCDNIVDSLWQYSHHVTAMNEANIEWGGFGPHPGRVEGWKHLNEWMLRWTKEFLKRRPDAIIHWPALSPGWGDDPAVMDPPGMWYCRESIEACHILDVHCYWSEGQHLSPWYGKRYEMTHKLFPSKYQFVSECAPNDYRRPSAAQEVVEWFQELYKHRYMLGGTAFTWMWNPGPDRQYHIIWNKPHVVEAMRSADKPLVEAPTNWIFNGGEEMQVKIWRRDLLLVGPVHTMGMEDYLGGVVCSEMYCSWLLEALKVQAVAARAYVMYHREHGGKHPAQGADLCTEACCQVYRESNITDKSVRAVTETKGIVLLDASNNVIQAQYVSKCGMGGCPYCQGQPGHDGKMWPGRMCQWGAKVSAEQGRSWREILKFCYPHAHLSDEEAPGPPPPPPEEDIVERLLEDLGDYLPPWDKWVGYNPHTALARAARLAQPPLGLPISGELRELVGTKPIVYQFFWGGLAWCPEKEYDNIHIVRY